MDPDVAEIARALADLRALTAEEGHDLRSRLERLEERVEQIERRVADAKPAGAKPAKGARGVGPKRAARIAATQKPPIPRDG